MSYDHYTTVELEEGFHCDVKSLIDALLDDRLVTGYTQAPAKIDRSIGGSYSLFEGAVTGTFQSIDQSDSKAVIVQSWHRKEWKDDDVSTVTITLSNVSRGVTRLNLVQKNVPELDKFGNRDQPMKVRMGWTEFIFKRIQQVLGYGKAQV